MVICKAGEFIIVYFLIALHATRRKSLFFVALPLISVPHSDKIFFLEEMTRESHKKIRNERGLNEVYILHNNKPKKRKYQK
ncbi:hypothetical protein HC02_00015 [Vibrio parahaemolyticus]|nr:hypothetical protein HC02_00015 [Vibrio parahaemolyticus]